jgi:hypothetical protein
MGGYAVNVVHLSPISQYGVKISWSEQGTPQTSFDLVVEESGKDTTFKTFVSILIIGQAAEHYAETLEVGDVVALSGELAFKAGKTKDSGKRQVVAFGVERLTKAAVVDVD